MPREVTGLLRDLDLEVPELRRTVEERGLKHKHRSTHNPSLSLAIGELLSVSPLEEEVVGGGKLGRQSPFAKPERTVSQGSVIRNAVQVADASEICVGIGIGNTLR